MHTQLSAHLAGRREPRFEKLLSIVPLALLALSLFVAGAASAQQAMKGMQSFDIPAQRLLPALDAFGEQSGLQIALGAEDATGMRTHGVNGNYTPEQALDILLIGSGLMTEIDDGVVIVTGADSAVMAQNRSSSPGTLPLDDVDAAPSGPLESIVVVGNATNALITADDLEVYQANDLADVFRLTPSISVGGGASGIAQKIYVRGLEDSLINVTVDGARQTSTLFHHIGRVTIDPELLKEVEVQAGAGEATSGAGAIGGSIRFRTKDAADLLAADRSIGGRFEASNYTNDGQQFNGSIYGRLSDSWGMLAYYSSIERDDVEDGDGVEMDGTAAEQTLGFFKISGDIGDDQRLSLSYENRKEEGQFTRWPNWSPLQGAPLYSAEGERDTVVANYQLQTSDVLDLDASVYHTQSGFQRELFTWNADITSTGFDIRNTSVTGDHRFTYGLDLRNDEVKSGEIGTVQYREEGQVMGLYAQGHSRVTDSLLLSYGVRFDDYGFDQRIINDGGAPLASIDDSDLSLNTGLAYDLTSEWTLSLGYAEAFRGLEITDGFTNWGTIVAPGLDASTVANIEAAIEYSGPRFAAKFAVFESDIDNVIYDQSGGPVLYENLGTVETDGFEMNFAYRLNNIEFYLGFAASNAKLDPADGVFSVDYGKIDLEAYEFGGLGNNRGDTWNLGLTATPLPNLSLGWNVTNVENLNDLEVLHRSVELGWIGELHYIDKPGYVFHDVFVEWRPRDTLRINLAVINLFDETYLDHSSVGDYTAIPDWEAVRGYNEPGRDIRLSASLSF